MLNGQSCEEHTQPTEFYGAKVVEVLSFPFPFYTSLPLSFGLSPRIYGHIRCGEGVVGQGVQ